MSDNRMFREAAAEQQLGWANFLLEYARRKGEPTFDLERQVEHLERELSEASEV